MSELDVHLRCPGCEAPVLDGWALVRCHKCEVLHHEKCWRRAGQCQGTHGCRGKSEPVLVARVPHPGPELADIDSIVEQRVEAVVSRSMVRLGQELPREEHLRGLGNEIQRLLDGAQIALAEDIRKGVETLERRMESLEKRIDEVDRRVRHLPRPAEPAAIEELRRTLEKRLATVAESGGVSDEQLDELKAEIRTELARARAQLDACHWELTALRHPLPWQDGRTGPLRLTPVEED